MPVVKNRAIDSPASASTRRLTAKRGPLRLNWKSSGVSSCHFWKLAGFWLP